MLFFLLLGLIFLCRIIAEQLSFQEDVVQQQVFVFLVRNGYDVGQTDVFKLLGSLDEVLFF
jgi:hypothetical protein